MNKLTTKKGSLEMELQVQLDQVRIETMKLSSFVTINEEY